jgi:hypothetical protein
VNLLAEDKLTVKEEVTNGDAQDVTEEEHSGRSEWSRTTQIVIWAGMIAFMGLIYWVMNNVNFNKIPQI